MSRIGKQPIIIPQGVEVEIQGQNVKVKGPKGEISQEIPENIGIELKDKEILLKPKEKPSTRAKLGAGLVPHRNGVSGAGTKKSGALWGLSRSLLANCVKGVTQGFQKELELIGIGYQASMEKEKKLVLEVGFSHKVELEIPQGIDISIKKNIITVSGIDKQKVGEVAAKIRKIRPPEPYKGKGIRYRGEKVRRKEGKKVATTAG